MRSEQDLLRRAIELSAEARASGNPPFGSLLASADGTILAEEHNTTLTDGDITAHPELKLARWAAEQLDPETAAATTMRRCCRLGAAVAVATAHQCGPYAGRTRSVVDVAHGKYAVVTVAAVWEGMSW